MRKLTFATPGYYHIFNRGVDKRKVFLNSTYFIRFIRTMYFLLNFGSATPSSNLNQGLALKLKINLICYCLMPNHYHLLLKQTADIGISEFMHNLNTSFTMFFNLNNKRKGRLFEYTFKAVAITSDEQLLHVSRYIHLNPYVACITKTLAKYKWSSYPDFIGTRNGRLCRKEEILQLIANDKQEEKYRQFVNDQKDYAIKLMLFKKTCLD